jgi:DNA modification methylase
LFCGDSTDENNLKILFAGEKPDSTITDPPYNVEYDYDGGYEDKKTDDEYIEFSKKWFLVAKKYTDFLAFTPGTVNLFMWSQIERWKSIAPWIKKNAMNSGEVTLIRTWEPILFYGKPAKRRSTDAFEYLIGNVAPDMLSKGEKVSHTCPKPLMLFVDMVKDFGCEKVFEPFAGSGTTLIACEKTGKTCFAAEIDPKYCDLVRKRYALMHDKLDVWQEFTQEEIR